MGEAKSNIGLGLCSRISAVYSAPLPRFSEIFVDLSSFCTLVEAENHS